MPLASVLVQDTEHQHNVETGQVTAYDYNGDGEIPVADRHDGQTNCLVVVASGNCSKYIDSPTKKKGEQTVYSSYIYDKHGKQIHVNAPVKERRSSHECIV